MTMVTDVYRYTETFPKTEIYGLTSQFAPCGGLSAEQYRGRAGPSFDR
jgi:hypothetical protein